jgi:predicted MFS family arabinose efflux permease
MSGCFYLNGISFLAVIAALFLIKVEHHNRALNKNTAINDLKEGLVFVMDNRVILILITIVGVVSLFGVSYVILMPIFANDVLKVGVRGLGMLMSFAGAGALLGALTLARLGDFQYKGRLLFFSSLVFSLSLILFGLSRVYLLSLVSLVFTGFASVTAISLINTILQTKVEDKFRGRVMSVFMLTFAGMMPFGNLISGALAHTLGVSFTVASSGLICTLFFIVINIIYPQLREL